MFVMYVILKAIRFTKKKKISFPVKVTGSEDKRDPPTMTKVKKPAPTLPQYIEETYKIK